MANSARVIFEAAKARSTLPIWPMCIKVMLVILEAKARSDNKGEV